MSEEIIKKLNSLFHPESLSEFLSNVVHTDLYDDDI